MLSAHSRKQAPAAASKRERGEIWFVINISITAIVNLIVIIIIIIPTMRVIVNSSCVAVKRFRVAYFTGLLY